MTDANTGRIERDVFIEAPPETVFEYLTDAGKMMRWMGVDVALDPKPNGIFMCNVDGENVARGNFVEVSPPERVVFTWGWDGGESLPPGKSTIEITLEPKDRGTMLRMVHSGLPEPTVGPHGEGWEHFIARLIIAAAGGDPGRDPWVKESAAAG